MINKRLKIAREQKEITQNELSQISGIPASIISLFEKGHRKPSFNNLVKLCKALEVSSDYLLEIDDVMSVNEKYNVQNALELMQKAVDLLNNNTKE